MIRTTATAAFLLVILSVSLSGAAAPQTLSKCTVQTRQLILPKGRSLRLTGTALVRGSVEYHVKPKVDTSLEIKLTTADHLPLNLYLLDPPTAQGNGTDTWQGTLSGGSEYTVAINNCSGRTSLKFQMDVKAY
ncbi:MAG TPA: hypothetical protein VHQ64_16030 [Pyrinomonadaceae bacterium]|jgi:hypothetical protein|nr:hypothetical protein [Pyrinomonadaceae bacterium]